MSSFQVLSTFRFSLDDTVYLSSRLISFIYEVIKKLDAQERIKIVKASDGSLKLERLEDVDDVFPYAIEEITEIKDKLVEKEEKKSQLRVTVKR